MICMGFDEFLKNGQYVAPPNTPDWNALTNISNNLKGISSFLQFISNPGNIAIFLWHSISSLGYVICLTICLASILLYIFNHKKYAKWVPTSIAIYTLIQALNCVFGR